VRIALGARQHSVLWIFLKDALRLTLCGIAIGLPLAIVSTRAIRSFLFGLEATDTVTFIVIVAGFSAQPY
jgi:ABC-type lipoprotein release transport system permease subunit